MPAAVAEVIAAVKAGVPLEVRAKASTAEYLEAVVLRPQLAQCEALLQMALGAPVKAFGAKASLPGGLKRIVDSIGGVWPDQCLYAAPGEGGTIYAALWPWKSDPARVTLKLGLVVQ